jgi:hypothetical protein
MSHPQSSGSSDSIKGIDVETKEATPIDQLDLIAYYENNAGRLVVDPEYVPSLLLHRDSRPHAIIFWSFREAKIEFGEAVASKLKLSSDGTKVLWPQPSNDPEDPQNVRFMLHDCYLALYSRNPT